MKMSVFVCVCVLKIYPALASGDREGKNVCVCVEDVSQGCHDLGKSQNVIIFKVREF